MWEAPQKQWLGRDCFSFSWLSICLFILGCCCAATESWIILTLAICVSWTNIVPSACFVCGCADSSCPAVSVKHLVKMEQILCFWPVLQFSFLYSGFCVSSFGCSFQLPYLAVGVLFLVCVIFILG